MTFVCMSFFIFTNNALADLTSDLDVFYPMNGNGMDASGNYNTATLNGDVSGVDNRSGANNFALSFDGNGDYLEAADSNSLDVDTDDCSFSFWIKPTTVSGTQVIIDKRDTIDHTGYLFYLYNAIPKFRIGHENYWTNGTCSISLTAEKWSHIVVTVDRDNPNGLIFYVNNVQSSGYNDPSDFDGLSLNNSSPLKIGVSRDNNSYFSGSLDDLRIYKRVLTSDEINALYTEINPDPIYYTSISGIPDQGSNGYGDIATLSKNNNGIYVQIDDSYDNNVSPIVINNFFGGSLDWRPMSISVVDLYGDTGIAVMARDEENDVAKVHTYNLDTSTFVNDLITLPLYGD